MSTQQQIDQYNAAIQQKQQEKADQETILRVQQEQLTKAETARINAELAAQRAQNSGASAEQVAALQRQARLADQAESDARVAASQTSNNIEKLDGSIRFNTSNRDQLQAALPAQGTPASTVADQPVNARTNAAEIAPAPVPAPAAAAPAASSPVTGGDTGEVPGVTTRSAAPVTGGDTGEVPGVTTQSAAPVPRSAIEEGGDAEAQVALAEQIRAEAAAPQREFVYDETTGEMVAGDSAQADAIRDEARINRPIDDPTGVLAAEDAAIAEQEALQGDADAFAGLSRGPEPVPPNLTQAWDPETGSYGVWDEDKGEFIETGLSEEDATRAAGDPFEAARLAREKEFEEEQPAVFDPDPVAPTLSTVWDSETGSYGVWADPPGEFQQTGFDTEEQAQAAIDDPTGAVGALDEESRAAAEAAAAEDPDGAERQAALEQEAAKVKAINQATLNSVYKKEGSADWRVRLQLAPTSDYLYNVPVPPPGGAGGPGILAPLAATNGVIFPYTPQINTAYKANYEQYDLVHSNYRGVYYKNSRVDDLSIRAVFTAQDTSEADYLLAVIHFFRSVTKMFYGKDEQRGSPPPLVYLSGFGMNQFYGHPCVVSSFQYNLPDNVDYIRATSVNNYGTDLLSRRTPGKASGTAGLGASGNRIVNAGLERFFPGTKPAPDSVVASVNNTQLANYVPTKMEIDISLIPVQTRSQVSKQFSLKGFANGDLIKGGFW